MTPGDPGESCTVRYKAYWPESRGIVGYLVGNNIGKVVGYDVGEVVDTSICNGVGDITM